MCFKLFTTVKLSGTNVRVVQKRYSLVFYLEAFVEPPSQRRALLGHVLPVDARNVDVDFWTFFAEKF